ncbi:phage baseplate protein [Clostridium saccharoperbutylacetonicum]|uniref:phage baseplate protein n=1 Tax=Clostridium saccharoperbutylacetonicum TaxID=36745 RepID=UPI0039E9F637
MADDTTLTYFSTAQGNYMFDAYFNIDHESKLSITEHPIQTGASISDHAYMEPRALTFEIGMSDVMQDLSLYVSGIKSFNVGDSVSRSVNAFTIIQKLQSDRIPIDVYTRLGIYKNMLIESIMVPDSKETPYALKATISLKELLVVNVTTVKVSARAQKTDSTNEGVQKPEQNESILSSIAGIG